MEEYLKIEQVQIKSVSFRIYEPYYCILLLDEPSEFSIELNKYHCSGKNLVFMSPYQHFLWNGNNKPKFTLLKFHGDFYCIEYHKKEVACNGILFNNIYQNPFVPVSEKIFAEILNIVYKIQEFENTSKSYDISIIKSYLQLILALSSREKQLKDKSMHASEQIQNNLANFQVVLDKHFLDNRSVSYYAEYYSLSVDAFSKTIKRNFKKTPSKLIQERIVLEAKKLLHLSFLNIKEIASKLNFKDEFHFSRYFKKEVGVSPKQFRDKVGISIVAK